MQSPRVVIFLSTGRCGTQWLTDTMSELYPRKLEIEHEPLGPLYRPRRYFRMYHEPDAILEVPEVARHMERIATLDRYAETGWPVFAALPMLAKRFGPALSVIHLTRHPVPTALSHLAHSSYAGSARDDAYTRMATLAPSDPNVFQPHYAERWHELSAYEKCIFWWTEVSLFGLEFPERFPDVPFLRVKSEDVLAGERETLERLVGHMGLPFDERWVERTSRRVDRWNHRTDRHVDPLQVLDHPLTVDTAQRLGYSPADLDLDALRSRYSGEPEPGLDRAGRYG